MYNNYIVTSDFSFNLLADPNGTHIPVSSSVANMTVLQNVNNHSFKHPLFGSRY